MDFHGNSVHHIGYGHPRLIAALRQQMKEDLPFCPRRFTCEPAVALAEKLSAIAPGNLSKVLFAPSGSDAIEIAMGLGSRSHGAFTRWCRSGMRIMAPALARAASVGKPCSARAALARC